MGGGAVLGKCAVVLGVGAGGLGLGLFLLGKEGASLVRGLGSWSFCCSS